MGTPRWISYLRIATRLSANRLTSSLLALVLLASGLLALGLLAGPSAVFGAGVAVEGRDWSQIQVPASALVESYENSGYRLTMTNGVAEIEVLLTPIASTDPFRLPSDVGQDSVGVLVRSLLIDASSRYEAVGRVLSWVSREIRYDLDRNLSQEPSALLERRSGYCTGIARLAVSMLSRAGVPAREVAGIVVTGEGDSSNTLYHRWIEVEYADRGWIFSDPSSFHHYVPAHYVRLASEQLMPSPERDRAVLRSRHDERHVVDLAPQSPSGVSSRRNDGRQLAGALEIRVEGKPVGVAVLEGVGSRRVKALIGGNSTFVGLQPGAYVLTVMVEGEEPLERELVVEDYVHDAVIISRG